MTSVFIAGGPSNDAVVTLDYCCPSCRYKVETMTTVAIRRTDASSGLFVDAGPQLKSVAERDARALLKAIECPRCHRRNWPGLVLGGFLRLVAWSSLAALAYVFTRVFLREDTPTTENIAVLVGTAVALAFAIAPLALRIRRAKGAVSFFERK